MKWIGFTKILSLSHKNCDLSQTQKSRPKVKKQNNHRWFLSSLVKLWLKTDSSSLGKAWQVVGVGEGVDWSLC